MSNVSDLGLDLENLFQPAWAQGKAGENRYEKFTGNEGAKPERRRGDRPGGLRVASRLASAADRVRRAPVPSSANARAVLAAAMIVGMTAGSGLNRRRRCRNIGVIFLPDDNGVESIARQIKMTGRAYPLFDIARLILQKPERYAVRLGVEEKSRRRGFTTVVHMRA